MTFARKRFCKNPLASIVPSSSCGHWFLLLLNLVVLPCGLPAPVLAQSQQPPATTPNAETGIPDQPLPGTIKGTILDRNGNPVSAAHVTLTREAPSPNQEFLTADDADWVEHVHGGFAYSDEASVAEMLARFEPDTSPAENMPSTLV